LILQNEVDLQNRLKRMVKNIYTPLHITTLRDIGTIQIEVLV